MGSISSVIKNIRNIMRQDRGASGDAARIEQMGWMIFLKVLDDKDQELEILHDHYKSVVPEKFQWRNWASNSEGITGDELLEFIDSTQQDNPGLFLSLKSLASTSNSKRASIVKEVFDGTNNYMKSGYEMRKVINELNKIDFNSSEHKHAFGDIYESILVELRDASTKGEFYTPRAVTELMTKMIDPKLGEKVLDPAAGTGGFLTATIDHIRENYVHTIDDEHIVQSSIEGWELKPVAYVLGLTNLILHGIDVPNYEYVDSLKTEYSSIGPKDQVDVILANPPFGASIADGVETNFPASYRCKESADLFVILMLKLLKPGARCAIVLPDGWMNGDGIKARIREKLLTDCNLHTIIRLPQSTFFPATVNTNLLFFEKGVPTKEIWYYEHKLPKGQKSYSKKKPIQFNEFKPIIDWWSDRLDNDLAWKVNFNDLKNWNLDIKNPFIEKTKQKIKSSEALQELKDSSKKINDLIDEIKSSKITSGFLKLINSLLKIIENQNDSIVEFGINKIQIKKLKQFIVQEAVQGKLTRDWRKKNTNTEPVSQLLERIKVEKANLIADKKIKKQKPLLSTNEDEITFKIPESWQWERVPFFFSVLSSRNKQIQSKDYLKSGKYPIVDQGKKMIVGYSDDDTKLIGVKKPVIVFGDHTREIKFIDFDFIPGADGTKILLIYKAMNPKYFYWALKSLKIEGRGYSRHFKLLKENLIPIPPLNEQIEIVKKIESLMQKCDELEEEIKKSEVNAEMLMQSVLKEAFDSQ